MFIYFSAPMDWRELLRRTVVDTLDDGCPGLAAQLAFYFFLALVPALLFLVALLSYLPIDTAVGSMLERARPFVPDDVLALIRRELDKLLHGDRHSLLTFAIAAAVWSSSSAMTAVISTVNQAYDITEFRPWWQLRVIAIALSIALAVFAVLALALVLGGTDLAESAAGWLGAGAMFERVWSFALWPVAVFFVILAIDLIYFFAPNADTRWVWISPGSVLATLLWLLASFGFKLYLEYVSNVAVVYGALGSVMVLLLWFYLAGFAILVGAELNAEIDRALPARGDRTERPWRRKRIGPDSARQRLHRDIGSWASRESRDAGDAASLLRPREDGLSSRSNK